MEQVRTLHTSLKHEVAKPRRLFISWSWKWAYLLHQEALRGIGAKNEDYVFLARSFEIEKATDWAQQFIRKRNIITKHVVLQPGQLTMYTQGR